MNNLAILDPQKEYLNDFFPNSIPNLPSEIIFDIIKKALNSQNINLQTIQNFCLVNHDFLNITKELIKKKTCSLSYPKNKNIIFENKLSIQKAKIKNKDELKSLLTIGSKIKSLELKEKTIENNSLFNKLCLLNNFKKLKNLILKIGPVISFNNKTLHEVVKSCPDLESLEIKKIDNSTLDIPDCFQDLSTLKKLEKLILNNATISDCSSLKELKNLKSLKLKKCEELNRSIIESLASFPKLEKIKINNMKFLDSDYEVGLNINSLEFPKLEKLKKVDFSYSDLNSESLSNIIHLNDVIKIKNLFQINSLAINTSVSKNDIGYRHLNKIFNRLNENFINLEKLKLNLMNEKKYNYPSCSYLKIFSNHPTMKQITLCDASLNKENLKNVFACNLNKIAFKNVHFTEDDYDFNDNSNVKEIEISYSKKNSENVLTLFPIHLLAPNVDTLIFNNCYETKKDLFNATKEVIQNLPGLKRIILNQGEKDQKIYFTEELLNS